MSQSCRAGADVAVVAGAVVHNRRSSSHCHCQAREAYACALAHDARAACYDAASAVADDVAGDDGGSAAAAAAAPKVLVSCNSCSNVRSGCSCSKTTGHEDNPYAGDPSHHSHSKTERYDHHDEEGCGEVDDGVDSGYGGRGAAVAVAVVVVVVVVAAAAVDDGRFRCLNDRACAEHDSFHASHVLSKNESPYLSSSQTIGIKQGSKEIIT